MTDKPVIALLSDDFEPLRISARDQASQACVAEVQNSLGRSYPQYKGSDLTEIAVKMPACIADKVNGFQEKVIPVSDETLDSRVNAGLTRAAGLGYREAELQFSHRFHTARPHFEAIARVEKYLQDKQISYTTDPKNPETLKVSW